MSVLYVIATVLCAAANTASATFDLVRYEPILTSMSAAGVPAGWLRPLGVLKTAGAAGLLLGFAVPALGTAAAVGLVLFYVGAVLTHLRVGDRAIGLPAGFLTLALAALLTGLARWSAG